MIKRIYRTIRYFSRKIGAHRVGAYSAEGAFFMMMSVFPFMILLLSLVRFLPFEIEQILDFFSHAFPREVDAFLTGFINDIKMTGSNTITWISAGGMLLSASKGVFSIMGGLNSVFEVRETRNYFKIRFLSAFYTVAFTLMILLTFFMLVFGNRIASLVERNYPSFAGMAFILSSLRYLIGFVILVIFFLLVYSFLPNKKSRFREQLPGAAVAATGWVAFSIVFSFYIDNFANYATVYGSLTAVIVMMLWLYTCMYILFIGAELNLYYIRKILEK